MNLKEKLNNRGITLIALVITIIVLLILAGVSIAMLTGENGILTQAQNAKDETEKASAMEEVQLEALGAIDTDGKINVDRLIDNISKNLNGANSTSLGNEVVVEYKGNKYLVEENGNVIYWEGGETKANAPKLAKGMIPVKYNVESGNWVICSEDDPEWYSYTTEEKKWANVMLCDGTYDESTAIGTEVAEKDLGSMFVWIPRYAYKITEGYHEASGALDVKFVAGTSYAYSDSKGNITEAKNGNEEGVITDTGYTDYVVHPAFTDGNKYNSFDNGEWREEIEGIWVAKFDAGIKTTEDDTSAKVSSSNTADDLYYPIFKGRKFGYNYVNVSQCYDISQSLDDNGNPYGINSLSNSHLMKNSEWGATAYLSISKYGYSEGSSSKEKAKNNLRVTGVTNPNNTGEITAITGYSATTGKASENSIAYSSESSLGNSVSGTNSQTSYAWNNCNSNSDEGNGTLSSTTGNIYGVYDMGGGLADYISAYVNSGSSNLTTYGGSFANRTSNHLSTAYPYNPVTTDYKDFNSGYNGTGWNKIFGDALWETSSGTGSGKAWFGQTLEEDGSSEEPFFPRGGYWYTTGTVGLCGLYDDIGFAYSNFGFRSVLVVE